MKKILLGIIILLIPFSITGCGKIKEDKKLENKANEILNNNQNSNNTSNNILVVYFSRADENYNVGNVEIGNTALMASYIKEYLNADSFEIVPVKAYPTNYKECTEVATEEKNNNARPEIKDKIENINKYDTIFIGYPIWWGDLPMIVYTFLESYDFKNITVIPFNTHEGSGNSGTYNTIKNKLNAVTVNTNGLALQGSVARTEDGKQKTIEWLKELGY